MKKNLKVILIVTGIIFILGAIGFWVYSTRKISENKTAETQTLTDKILFYREDELYEMNIPTKEMNPYQPPEGKISGEKMLTEKIKSFSGLPKETEDNKTQTTISKTLLSQDQTKAIVVYTTYDKTKKPGAFDGQYPVLSAQEFVCDIKTGKCYPTNYLELAYNAVAKINKWNNEKWFDNVLLYWDHWDSKNNLLYGHLSGEGVGNAAPVYIFDLNNKTLKFTVGYNSLNEKEKSAGVPGGAFSPTLQKFVMVGEGEKNKNAFSLLLYNTNDLSAPIKKYEISIIDDKERGPYSVAWSKDEKTLVLITNKSIYTLNLESGETTLRYADNTLCSTGLWLDFNQVSLSSSGRYIVFVDYEDQKTPEGEQKPYSVLKAIDLQDNNKVIELLREPDLSIFSLF